MNDVLLAFVSIFVAVDPIGVLPIFLGLTYQLDSKSRRKIIILSLITALCVAVGFIFLGKIILQTLGITVGDFMIAGGAILFCISILDLIYPDKVLRVPSEELGAVPIGTPLIVGPGVLTACLIVIDRHGLQATLAAVLSNILLVGILFFNAEALLKVLGHAGARVLSKVTSLFLAAFAVMMIRKGVLSIMGL